MLAYYLIDWLSGPDGDDKLLPRTIPEDPCSGELGPEVWSIAPWLDIPKPLAWELWKPSETASGLDAVTSQRSRGLHPGYEK